MLYCDKVILIGTSRDNRIGKLNESSGTTEYIYSTTGSPRGIAVDPFNRCVTYCLHAQLNFISDYYYAYSKLFWSESSSIVSLDLDSNETTALYTSINGHAGLTIDILQERIYFVDNLVSSYSNIYSIDYDGQHVTLVVENHSSIIPFQIAYADDFVYWTKDNQRLQRIQVGTASSTISSVPVTLQTESGSDSSFYSLVAVSTLHRPPAGSYI